MKFTERKNFTFKVTFKMIICFRKNVEREALLGCGTRTTRETKFFVAPSKLI